MVLLQVIKFLFMKRTLLLLGGFGLASLFLSCHQDSLEEELTGYCDCMRRASSDVNIQKCREKLQGIADKYAYDPEASEIIKKRLQDCVSN